MISPAMPFLVAYILQNPAQIDLRAPSSDLLLFSSDRSELILLAQKHDPDPKGPDPHGADPHDENNDPGLPANQEHKARKAPKDVYGGEIPNSKEPY